MSLDQTVADTDGNGSELITLNGSGSTDDEGIVAYQWSENGSILATGVSPQLTLAVGVHTLTLTVIDADGATTSDFVSITVESAPAQNPVIQVASIILKGTVDGQGSPVQSITISVNGGLPENVDTLIINGNTATWEKEIEMTSNSSSITITSENEAELSSSTVMTLAYWPQESFCPRTALPRGLSK